MEIRNNSTSGMGSNRIDLTKANRDAIREQSPSPPEPEAVKADPARDAKRVAAARDRFEAQQEVDKHVAKRVRDARAEFSVEKRVREARAEFSVTKRVQTARKEFVANAPEDKLTLSSSAKDISGEESLRAQRVNELKEQHQNGQLDVQGLVAEAAFRMLSAD